MLVDERDSIAVKNGAGRDGDIVTVKMRVVKLSSGTVLYPCGPAVKGGLRISTRKANSKRRQSAA